MLYDLTAIDERMRDAPRGSASERLHRRLSSALFRAQRRRADQGGVTGRRRRLPAVTGVWPRRLVRARGVGHVRHPLRGPPQPAPHPHTRPVAGPSAAQGAPRPRATEMGPFTCCRRQAGAEQEELRSGPKSGGWRRWRPTLISCSSTSARSTRHARRVAHITAAATARRSSTCARHRLSSSRRREDGRAPELAHLHPLHRPDRLPRRRDEQPRLLPGRRAAGRHRRCPTAPRSSASCSASCSASPAIWSGTARSPRTSERCRRCSTCSATASASSTSWRPITGGRMHPSWFRIGGVADDLPEGWEALVRDFLDYLPKRLREYDGSGDEEPHRPPRTEGVGRLPATKPSSGVSPARACGLPASTGTSARSGPTRATTSSSSTSRRPSTATATTARPSAWRRSARALRIIRQCLDDMPAGDYKARPSPDHAAAQGAGTMHDIETLINHFLGVSWGPVIPPGEASSASRRRRATTAIT